MTIQAPGKTRKSSFRRAPRTPKTQPASRDSLGSLVAEINGTHDVSLVWSVRWSEHGEPLQEAWKASADPSAMVVLLLYLDDTGARAWRAVESVCRVLRAPGSSSWRNIAKVGFGGVRASAQNTMETMVRACTRTQVKSAFRLHGIRFLCDTIREQVPFAETLPDLLRELARFT